MKRIPDIIIDASRKLRKEMTDAEKILWDELKSKKFKNTKFLRQSPVYVYSEDSGLDRYIISDFLCKEYNLIIELDGSVHNEEAVYQLDNEKEKLLKNIGYKIIRFQNKEILNNLNESLNKIAASFPG